MFNNNFYILKRKLKEIKFIAMDFDGVLTDGGIYLNKDSNGFRRFDVKDGMGIKLLQKASIKLALISGSNSDIINKRASHLKINLIEKGVSNKFDSLIKIQNDLSITKEQTLFLGDDVNDLNVIPIVSLFIVPSNAHISCKNKANYIGKYPGGQGFIREVADIILNSKGLNPFEAFCSRNDHSE